MEAEFGKYLEERFPSTDKRTSGVIRASFGGRIIAVVWDPTAGDKNMRFYVKKRKFQFLDLPSLGMKNVMVVPTKTEVFILKSCVSV